MCRSPSDVDTLNKILFHIKDHDFYSSLNYRLLDTSWALYLVGLHSKGAVIMMRHRIDDSGWRIIYTSRNETFFGETCSYTIGKTIVDALTKVYESKG